MVKWYQLTKLTTSDTTACSYHIYLNLPPFYIPHTRKIDEKGDFNIHHATFLPDLWTWSQKWREGIVSCDVYTVIRFHVYAKFEIQVCVLWNSSLHRKNQVCVSWNQVFVSRNQVCVLWNQVCTERIKFAFRGIKFAFCRIQVCIERIKFA